MRVGVAGLGRMGSAIAARLMEVGHAVTVWNRSTDKVEPLAAASPAELAAQVEAIVTILTNRDAIAAVYEGHSGLLAGNVKGKLFIEMSTVQPETEVALAETVQAKGGTFVECPVGGTVGPAREGKLLGVAGGTAADFADVDSIRKDLATMVAEGKTRGASLPLAERTLAVYDEAAKDGWGKRDGASLPAYWPTRSRAREKR